MTTTKKRTDRFGQEIVSCRICGDDTTYSGTRLCNGCYEVDGRMPSFIKKADTEYLRRLRDKIRDELKER